MWVQAGFGRADREVTGSTHLCESRPRAAELWQPMACSWAVLCCCAQASKEAPPPPCPCHLLFPCWSAQASCGDQAVEAKVEERASQFCAWVDRNKGRRGQVRGQRKWGYTGTVRRGRGP